MLAGRPRIAISPSGSGVSGTSPAWIWPSVGLSPTTTWAAAGKAVPESRRQASIQRDTMGVPIRGLPPARAGGDRRSRRADLISCPAPGSKRLAANGKCLGTGLSGPAPQKSRAVFRSAAGGVAVHEAEIGGDEGEHGVQPDVVAVDRDQAEGGVGLSEQAQQGQHRIDDRYALGVGFGSAEAAAGGEYAPQAE